MFSEYHKGGLTAGEHARKVQSSDPVGYAVGGAKSEGQWRQEFGAGGLPIGEPPVSEVEVGINRVYGAIKEGKLFILDNCVNLIDQVLSYARELNSMSEPTEKIADKSTYHLLDALRYIMSYLNPPLDSSGFVVW